MTYTSYLLSLLLVVSITAAVIVFIRRLRINKLKRAQLSRIKGSSLQGGTVSDSMPGTLKSTVRKRDSNVYEGFFGRLAGNISALVESSMLALGLRVNVNLMVIIWIMLVVLFPSAVMLIRGSMLESIAVLIVFLITPFIIMSIMKKKRTELFENQLTDAIDVLKVAIKAGHSFQDSLSVVAQSSDDPIRTEFQILFDEITLGAHITDALENMKRRIDSREMDIFCSALLMQITTGGNLIIVLENIAETIRTRIRIKKEIKSKTAPGRLSGVIVGALPFLLIIFIRITTPDYFNDFLLWPFGRILIGTGLVLMLIGILLIRKITDIKY